MVVCGLSGNCGPKRTMLLTVTQLKSLHVTDVSTVLETGYQQVENTSNLIENRQWCTCNLQTQNCLV